MPGVIGTQVTVRWRLGDPTIDMVSESGRLVATHRKAPRGLGRVVRLPEHTSALENAVLAAFTTKRPCKPKPNRPPTTAKTRKPRTANSDGPHLPIEDEVCCVAFASVTVDLLDSFQRIPYGTLAWKQSYGRRNIIEKANSMLKDKGGLNAESVPGFRPRRSNHRSPGPSRSPEPKRTETLPRTPKTQRHRPRSLL